MCSPGLKDESECECGGGKEQGAEGSQARLGSDGNCPALGKLMSLEHPWPISAQQGQCPISLEEGEKHLLDPEEGH